LSGIVCIDVTHEALNLALAVAIKFSRSVFDAIFNDCWGRHAGQIFDEEEQDLLPQKEVSR